MIYRLLELGLTDYDKAYAMQHNIVSALKNGKGNNTLLLLEHYPVFTIGRSGSIGNLLCDEELLDERGIKLRRVDRGGDITFHGEGQLVIYPIFNLCEHKRDLHKYLRTLEDAIIKLLLGYGINGERAKGLTGVWVGNKKIASIGIGVKNWISYHGIALNVNVDLDFFSLIRPCGLGNIAMTSLKELLGKNIPMQEIKNRAINVFEAVFGLEALN